jgi:superfamily I DNA and RNA helicase
LGFIGCSQACKVLSARKDRRYLYSLPSRIVYGVAGSGKTVLLIAREKLLAEDPEKRILVLCYNRLLAQHLTVALAGRSGVKVTTFHRLGVRCGVDFREGEEDGAFGERLLARLQGDAGLRGRYDAVLIDEAQDWPCSFPGRCGLCKRASRNKICST